MEDRDVDVEDAGYLPARVADACGHEICWCVWNRAAHHATSYHATYCQALRAADALNAAWEAVRM